MVSNIAWVLSNLCRNNKPSPPRETVLQLIPVFVELFDYEGSEEVTIDTAWAISYITDIGVEYIDDIVSSGCVHRLIRVLSSDIVSYSPQISPYGFFVDLIMKSCLTSSQGLFPLL